MKKAFLKNTVQFVLGLALLICSLALTGCETATPHNDIRFSSVPEGEDMPASTGYSDEAMRFAKDDLVIITFVGPENLGQIPPHEERIKEDGTVTLPLIGAIRAEGKTTGELQRDIYNAYVPSFYKRLTVTVKTDRLIYYVQGQVRQSGRQEYLGPTTVLKAIASAGDFTDFADRKKVIVTRKDGTRLIVNCIKAAKDPALDIAIFPGDKIEVPNRPAFGF
jgi:polysaccharide export outer membrane protein